MRGGGWTTSTMLSSLCSLQYSASSPGLLIEGVVVQPSAAERNQNAVSACVGHMV